MKKIVNISFEQSEEDKKNNEVTCHIDWVDTNDIKIIKEEKRDLSNFDIIPTIRSKD